MSKLPAVSESIFAKSRDPETPKPRDLDTALRPRELGPLQPHNELEDDMAAAVLRSKRAMATPAERKEDLDIHTVASWLHSLNTLSLLLICEQLTKGEGYKPEWPTDVELMVRVARWAKRELYGPEPPPKTQANQQEPLDESVQRVQ